MNRRLLCQILIVGLLYTPDAHSGYYCRMIVRKLSTRIRLVDAINESFAQHLPPFVMSGNRVFMKPLVQDLLFDLKLVNSRQRRHIFHFIGNIQFSENSGGVDAYVKFDSNGRPGLVVNRAYQYSPYFLVLFRREFFYLVNHFVVSSHHGLNANRLSRHFMALIRSSDVKSYQEDINALLVQQDFMERVFASSTARDVLVAERKRLETSRVALQESMAYEMASKDHDVKTDQVQIDLMEQRIMGINIFLADLRDITSRGMRELISIRLGLEDQ